MLAISHITLDTVGPQKIGVIEFKKTYRKKGQKSKLSLKKVFNYVKAVIDEMLYSML